MTVDLKKESEAMAAIFEAVKDLDKHQKLRVLEYVQDAVISGD